LRCGTDIFLLIAWQWWRIPYAPHIVQIGAPLIAFFPLVAISFQADDLYNIGQEEPIILLFVGTLVKSYLGM
jgi:hypothetical protein